MSDYGLLAELLENSLGLKTPPVAVTFPERVPDNMATPDGPVAAGCSFWELGARQALVTNAIDHQHCSIGVHTHNLSGAPDSQSSELQTTLAAMQGLDYVRPEEVAALPVIQSSSEYVVYAPLKDLGNEAPSVVIIFADAAQGLVISEALARVDGATPAAMGRPACAFIPQILNSSRSAASLGCCGARAYLGALADGITLWGLFGGKLESYVNEIETLAKANNVLTQFHEMRRADFLSGATPSVEQSLGRLG